MKLSKFFSLIFALLGMVLATVAVVVTFRSLDAAPVLLSYSGEAEVQAEALMDAICEGDFSAAGAQMYGQPDLGVDRQPADTVGVLIWDAFVDSLAYEFHGNCYATDAGVARDVTITCLDISSVTDTLGERSRSLLAQRVAEAEDIEQIYDENGEYREDFVMEVLYDAAVQALKEDAVYETQDVTLNLTYQQDRWWVLPSQPLIAAISGGIAG